jgi:nucleotide-binding universal stress UspA family protein
MNTTFLLGIDATYSPVTQHTLRIASEVLEQFSPRLSLLPLTVIPVPYRASPTLSSLRGSFRPLPPTMEQREGAEQALRSAQKALLGQGIAPERLKVLLRVGIPADEIVKAARELQVDCIVIGCRGNALGQKLWRIVFGSTSRRVLRLATCPVMVVTSLQPDRGCDLVAWYEAAVKRTLEEQPDAFTILKQTEVAHLFVPPTSSVVGRRELGAASRALEHLVSSGVLFRYDAQGERRYIND